MAAYRYDPGEAPVFEIDNVSLIRQDKGLFEKDPNGKLVLTNRNLIWLEKGAFNSIKNVYSFPLAEVQIHAGQAYISAQNKGNSFHVSFFFYHAAPTFRISDKRKTKRIIDELNYLVGDPEVIASLNKKPANLSEGVAAIAGMVMDSIGLSDSSFSLRTNAPGHSSAANITRSAPVGREEPSIPRSMTYREMALQYKPANKERIPYQNQRTEYGPLRSNNNPANQPLRATARTTYENISTRNPHIVPSRQTVAIRCPFCTAPVSGVSGEIVCCEYCGSHINISECLK